MKKNKLMTLKFAGLKIPVYGSDEVISPGKQENVHTMGIYKVQEQEIHIDNQFINHENFRTLVFHEALHVAFDIYGVKFYLDGRIKSLRDLAASMSHVVANIFRENPILKDHIPYKIKKFNPNIPVNVNGRHWKLVMVDEPEIMSDSRKLEFYFSNDRRGEESIQRSLLYALLYDSLEDLGVNELIIGKANLSEEYVVRVVSESMIKLFKENPHIAGLYFGDSNGF